ncbi:DinB family protein [Deinococcus sonorensis]|uniref:DinB family protein n=2 Tax=Deinococcus sonorensis TaxID=309891 RepID=A0AAU7UB63_9DEIO
MTTPTSDAAGALRAFGDTPEQIGVSLEKAFDRYEAALPGQQARWLVSPAPDRWSPAQITEHVIIVNEGTARVVGLLLSQKPLREVPQVPGTLVDGKRKAPAITEPGPGSAWSELEPRWQASRAALLALVPQLAHADPERTYWQPFMGELGAADWMRLASYHMRNHLRQLEN